MAGEGEVDTVRVTYLTIGDLIILFLYLSRLGRKGGRRRGWMDTEREGRGFGNLYENGISFLFFLILGGSGMRNIEIVSFLLIPMA